MEQIIVLGANGIVGRKLVQNLRAKGLSFRTAGRTSANVYFDWDDARTYHRALEGGHSLYLVPPALVAYPAPKVERLLEIAKNIGIRRVVAVSSLGVAFPTEEPGSGRHHYEEVVR